MSTLKHLTFLFVFEELLFLVECLLNAKGYKCYTKAFAIILDENCNTNSLNSFAISMSHIDFYESSPVKWIPQSIFNIRFTLSLCNLCRYIRYTHAHVRHICGEYCLMLKNNGINLANNIIIIKPLMTRNSYVSAFNYMHKSVCSSRSRSVLMITIILTHVGNNEHAVDFIESHESAVCHKENFFFFEWTGFNKKFIIFQAFERCFPELKLKGGHNMT